MNYQIGGAVPPPSPIQGQQQYNFADQDILAMLQGDGFSLPQSFVSEDQGSRKNDTDRLGVEFGVGEDIGRFDAAYVNEIGADKALQSPAGQLKLNLDSSTATRLNQIGLQAEYEIDEHTGYKYNPEKGQYDKYDYTPSFLEENLGTIVAAGILGVGAFHALGFAATGAGAGSAASGAAGVTASGTIAPATALTATAAPSAAATQVAAISAGAGATAATTTAGAVAAAGVPTATAVSAGVSAGSAVAAGTATTTAAASSAGIFGTGISAATLQGAGTAASILGGITGNEDLQRAGQIASGVGGIANAAQTGFSNVGFNQQTLGDVGQVATGLGQVTGNQNLVGAGLVGQGLANTDFSNFDATQPGFGLGQGGQQLLQGAAALGGANPGEQALLGQALGGTGGIQGGLGVTGGTQSALGGLAQLYETITGAGAKDRIDLIRAQVPEVAGLDDDQIAALDLQRQAATDPRIAQAVDQQFQAAQQGSGALTSGLDVLQGIATGDDATSQRLASQAAAASQLSAAGQGALGSARSQRASQTAAADVLAGRQQSAAGQIAGLGQGLLGQAQQGQQLATGAAGDLYNVGTQERAYQQQLLNQPAQVAQAQVQANEFDRGLAGRILESQGNQPITNVNVGGTQYGQQQQQQSPSALQQATNFIGNAGQGINALTSAYDAFSGQPYTANNLANLGTGSPTLNYQGVQQPYQQPAFGTTATPVTIDSLSQGATIGLGTTPPPPSIVPPPGFNQGGPVVNPLLDIFNPGGA